MIKPRNKDDILKQAKDIFEYVTRHPNTIRFREEAIKAFQYNDGVQYSEERKNILKSIGQEPLVYNRINSAVKSIIGIEVATKKKIVFKSQQINEDNEEELAQEDSYELGGKVSSEDLSEAMSNIAMSIQERSNYTLNEVVRFRHGLICGIGWGGFIRRPVSGEIEYEVIHPLDIMFDPDDITENFTNMSYVCRMGYMSLEKAKSVWSKSKAQLEELEIATENDNATSDMRSSTIQPDVFVFGKGIGKSIRFVEVQTKEEAVCYEGFTANKKYIKTFNKEEAYKLIEDVKSINVTTSTQLKKTVFTSDILLERGNVEPAIPDVKDFSYIPFVYSKLTTPNIPVGLVNSLFDIQDHWNFLYSRIARDMSSYQVIVSTDTLEGNNPEGLRSELRRRDGVVVKKKGTDLEYRDNLSSAQFCKSLLPSLNEEYQSRVGFYDEAIGKQTNATSGIAIQSRQSNSVNNQRFAFDNLNLSRKREGYNLLSLIQTSGVDFLEASILTDKGKKVILLNSLHEVNGKMEIYNDIRTLPVDIYIEEIDDYGSLAQADNDKFMEILRTPNILPLLTSPEICKRVGFWDAKKASREIKEILNQGLDNPEQEQVDAPEQMTEER